MHLIPSVLLLAAAAQQATAAATSCVASDIATIKSSVKDYVYFCNFYTSATRYQTPFPDLSEVATLAACKCINSQNAVPSTPKALPAASGPACSSKNSDYVAITKDFTSAAAFCRFYLTNAASTDSHSPVAGLTQQRVLNACNCGNSGSTTSAATTVKTSAKTTTTVKTTTKTTTKTSTKTTAKTTTTSKKPTTTTAVQSSVYNPDSQIDYTPAPVAWVLRTVSDNNTLDDLYVVVQNASNSVSSLGLGSQTQATNFYVQESFLQVYTNPSSNLPQWAVAVNGNGSQSGQMVFSTNNNEDYWMSNSVNCFVTDESSVYCVSASGLPYYSYVNSKTLTVSFFTSPTPPSGYQAVHLELDVGPYYFYLMDAYNFDSMVLASSNASTGKALDKLSLIGPMEGGAGSAKFYFERVTASIREATTNWPLSMLQPSGKIAFVNPQYAAELNGTMMVAFVNPWDGSLMITDSTVTDFYGIYYNGTSPTGFELINVNSNATGYTYETLLGFYPSPPIGHNTVVYTNAGS